MTRIRAAFFDFQETLAEFREGDAYDLYLEAARERGVHLDRERLLVASDDAWAEVQTPDGPAHPEASRDEASFLALRVRVHSRRLAAAGVNGTVAEAIAAGVDTLEADPSRYVVYEDVVPALEALGRMGVQCVVVSNHVWRLPEVVRGLGLGARFEGVITSARAGYRKPLPRIFEQALALTGIPPEETVMVGDTLSHDVHGAERLGIHGVLIDRDGTRPAPEGVRVIRSLLQVPLQWP
jgi:putative hydrolase of the HAD superfamily